MELIYLCIEIGHSIKKVLCNIPVCKFFMSSSALGQNPALKSAHAEQKIGVVLAINRDKSSVPLDGGHGSWQSILDVPKDSSSKIDVMFHQSHSSISWPAFFVVVSDNVFIVGIRMFGQVPLDQITCFFGSKSEKHVNTIHVSGIQSNRMRNFRIYILESQKVIGHLRRACHVCGSVHAQDQKVHNQSVVLNDKA